MTYTDGTRLIADTLEELHFFAREMGIKPEWFQQKRLKYYTLPTKRAAKRALSLGATMVSSKELDNIAKRVSSSKT